MSDAALSPLPRGFEMSPLQRRILEFLGRCHNQDDWFTAPDIATELGTDADAVATAITPMVAWRGYVERIHDGTGKTFYQITYPRGVLALGGHG